MEAPKVKNMISIFENYSTTSVNSEAVKLSKKRTKSFSSVTNTYKTKHQEYKSESITDLELVQIEQQVDHLNNRLANYKTYSRENHIYYQNQIFFLLTDIINIDTRDDPYIINKKSDLIELLKRLNTGLNSRLPSANKKQTTMQVRLNPKQVHIEPPVVSPTKKVDENRMVSRRAEVVSRSESEDVFEREESKEEVDGPAPSVKTLKQLWEKNISENEKLKKKENEEVKVSQTVLKLNGSTKYVPYSELLMKINAAEGNPVVRETSMEMYEDSKSTSTYRVNEDDSSDPRLRDSDGGSDTDSDDEGHDNDKSSDEGTIN